MSKAALGVVESAYVHRDRQTLVLDLGVVEAER